GITCPPGRVPSEPPAEGRGPLHSRLMSGSQRLEVASVRRNRITIPVSTIFDDASLRWIINIDNAEAFSVTKGPLEVIHQRPDKIASERYTIDNGSLRLKQVIM